MAWAHWWTVATGLTLSQSVAFKTYMPLDFQEKWNLADLLKTAYDKLEAVKDFPPCFTSFVIKTVRVRRVISGILARCSTILNLKVLCSFISSKTFYEPFHT